MFYELEVLVVRLTHNGLQYKYNKLNIYQLNLFIFLYLFYYQACKQKAKSISLCHICEMFQTSIGINLFN